MLKPAAAIMHEILYLFIRYRTADLSLDRQGSGLFQVSAEGRPVLPGSYTTKSPTIILYFVLQLPQLLEFQLIARLGAAGVDCSDGQLQHGVGGQTS
jgi:hypothetical protein